MNKKTEPYRNISLIYDEIRPSYPEQLIQDIITATRLKPDDALLEIGAGTGKATLQFADKGFTVDAVELGKDMAEVFKNKCAGYPNVSLDIASFEEWDNPNHRQYDMIYCAQAFHWLDPALKYTKCHRLLKDQGYLVLFWYKVCDDATEAVQEMELKVEKIVGKYAADRSLSKDSMERITVPGASKEDEIIKEIAESRLFELVQKVDYFQETKNNAAQYLKVKKSVPAFASILDGMDARSIQKMDDEIGEVIHSYGGYVSSLLEFSLYIAKKLN